MDINLADHFLIKKDIKIKIHSHTNTKKKYKRQFRLEDAQTPEIQKRYKRAIIQEYQEREQA